MKKHPGNLLSHLWDRPPCPRLRQLGGTPPYAGGLDFGSPACLKPGDRRRTERKKKRGGESPESGPEQTGVRYNYSRREMLRVDGVPCSTATLSQAPRAPHSPDRTTGRPARRPEAKGPRVATTAPPLTGSTGPLLLWIRRVGLIAFPPESASAEPRPLVQAHAQIWNAQLAVPSHAATDSNAARGNVRGVRHP